MSASEKDVDYLEELLKKEVPKEKSQLMIYDLKSHYRCRAMIV